MEKKDTDEKKKDHLEAEVIPSLAHVKDGIVVEAMTEESPVPEVRRGKGALVHALGQDLNIDIEARVEAEVERRKKE